MSTPPPASSAPNGPAASEQRRAGSGRSRRAAARAAATTSVSRIDLAEEAAARQQPGEQDAGRQHQERGRERDADREAADLARARASRSGRRRGRRGHGPVPERVRPSPGRRARDGSRSARRRRRRAVPAAQPTNAARVLGDAARRRRPPPGRRCGARRPRGTSKATSARRAMRRVGPRRRWRRRPRRASTAASAARTDVPGTIFGCSADQRPSARSTAWRRRRRAPRPDRPAAIAPDRRATAGRCGRADRRPPPGGGITTRRLVRRTTRVPGGDPAGRLDHAHLRVVRADEDVHRGAGEDLPRQAVRAAEVERHANAAFALERRARSVVERLGQADGGRHDERPAAPAPPGAGRSAAARGTASRTRAASRNRRERIGNEAAHRGTACDSSLAADLNTRLTGDRATRYAENTCVNWFIGPTAITITAPRAGRRRRTHERRTHHVHRRSCSLAGKPARPFFWSGRR